MSASTVPAPAEPAAIEPVVDEIAGAARLAGVLVDTLVGPIQETHAGIAAGVFDRLGPVATPIRLAHDAIVGVSYGAVRGGARLAGGAAGLVLGLTGRGRDRRPISAHPRGAQALAFGRGLLGERMGTLVVRSGCSQHGRPLPTDPAGLVAALDGTTDRLVLLLHGLAETTAAWGWWPTDADGEPVATYAERLAAVGWTPLEVTYDTGLPVADSGVALATLVEDLLAAWPDPVAEVALVGHSMGGLVAGAACGHGLDTGAPWVDLVSHLVTLGTPHGGSWLARAADGGAATAARRPATRGLATFLDLRSPGIQDLTRGWRPGPDPLPVLMPETHHAYVSAALPGPVDRLVGDGLVHARSATAPGRAAGEVPNVTLRHRPGVGHLRLVHDAAVADDLVTWLGPRRG